MNKLRIVSDGTAMGTRVYSGDVLIEGITKIEILPIVAEGVLTAKLTFGPVDLDIEVGLDGN